MRYLAIILALSACATPYQKKGFLGGYSETKIGPEMYSITANGNGYTSLADVQQMTLKRAYELCPNGYSILAGNKDSNTYLTSGFNNVPKTVSKPSAILVVRCNKGE